VSQDDTLSARLHEGDDSGMAHYSLMYWSCIAWLTGSTGGESINCIAADHASDNHGNLEYVPERLKSIVGRPTSLHLSTSTAIDTGR
jgi:hypothetical protein